jgi:hypothetical protein
MKRLNTVPYDIKNNAKLFETRSQLNNIMEVPVPQ